MYIGRKRATATTESAATTASTAVSARGPTATTVALLTPLPPHLGRTSREGPEAVGTLDHLPPTYGRVPVGTGYAVRHATAPSNTGVGTLKGCSRPEDRRDKEGGGFFLLFLSVEGRGKKTMQQECASCTHILREICVKTRPLSKSL